MKKLFIALSRGAFAILLSVQAQAGMAGGDNSWRHYPPRDYAIKNTRNSLGYDCCGLNHPYMHMAVPKPDTSPPSVEASDCGTDNDGDGVADCRDDCSATPEGTQVDAWGCRMDGDMDGVVDAIDKCDNSKLGSRVAGSGCPSLPLAVVYFANDSDALSKASMAELDNVANEMKGNLGMRLEIQGHTDWNASRHYNAGLADRRAEAVRRYLHSKGMDTIRMKRVGFSDSRPRFYNETPEGRSKNRRVEIHVVRDLDSIKDGPSARENDSIR